MKCLCVYKKILIFLFFFVASAIADEDWFYGFDSYEKDTLWVVHQRNLMDSFFTEPSVDWGKEGLYLFIDDGTVTRLLYWGLNKTIFVYQYPRQRNLRWLNPEAYLEERKNNLDHSLQKKCRHMIRAADDLKSFLSKHPLSMVPDIRACAPCRTKSCHRPRASLINKTYYSGYYRFGDSVEYFQFKDFREEGMVLAPPLSAVGDLLDILTKAPFTTKVEECP